MFSMGNIVLISLKQIKVTPSELLPLVGTSKVIDTGARKNVLVMISFTFLILAPCTILTCFLRINFECF